MIALLHIVSDGLHTLDGFYSSELLQHASSWCLFAFQEVFNRSDLPLGSLNGARDVLNSDPRILLVYLRCVANLTGLAVYVWVSWA